MKKVLLFTGFGIIILGLLSFSNRVIAQGMVPVNNFTSRTTSKAIPGKSVIETISTSGRSQLTDLIMKAGLISHLSGKKSYTFFAPSEEALNQLHALSADKLHGLLLNHMVAGEFKLSDFNEGTRLKTMGGDYLTIIRKGNTILINGIAIATADEPASNGVIHTLTSYLH